MGHSRVTAAQLFAGPDQTQTLLRSIDWAGTALGPPAGWPDQLCAAIRMVLACRMPMEIDWGPELIRIYNDAARANLGDRHPAALGRPAVESWPQAWDVIGPVLRAVLDGSGARYTENTLMILNRAGYLEETYWTASTSPIPDRSAQVRGVLIVPVEVTAQVVGARRLRMVRELGGISAAAAGTAQAACRALLRVLEGDRSAVPCASLYLPGDIGAPPQCVTSIGVRAEAAVLQAAGAADDAELVQRVLGSGQPELITGLHRHFPPGVPLRGPLGPLLPDEAMAYPLQATDQAEPVGMLMVGLSPYRRLDEAYREFLGLLSRQTAIVLTDAQTFEAESLRAKALTEDARHENANLRIALSGDRAISYAVGILMALQKVAAPEAFELLRQHSRNTNRKIREVANEVILTGALPEDHRRGGPPPTDV